MLPRRCVYTCLLGDYEPLNEQPQALAGDIPFICFTDDPALTSSTWQLRLVSPLFPSDPGRSQRHIKILAHRHLPDFDRSLYIDNSVILQASAEEIFDRIDPGPGLCLPLHSYRTSVLDEFLEVAAIGLDDPGRIFEQLNQYSLEAPALLERVPYWCGLMLRDHHAPQVVAAMETWFAHVLRYARRDQLSAHMAFHAVELEPATLSIDNMSSWFHRWPVVPERRVRMSIWNGRDRLGPPAARLRRQQQEMEQLRSELDRAVTSRADAEAAARHAMAAAEAGWACERLAAQGDLARRETALAALEQEMAALRAERDSLAAAGHANLAGIASLAAERDALAAARDTLAAERDALAAERDALAAQRDTLAAAEPWLRAEAARGAALDRDIAALRASTSWRLTGPLRRLMRRLRG